MFLIKKCSYKKIYIWNSNFWTKNERWNRKRTKITLFSTL